MDTTTTLDTLDDNSRYIAFSELLLYGEGVVEVQESHWVALVEWCLNLWIIGYCYRATSAAMEAAMESYHTALAGMERGEFESILIALCTGVVKEKGVILVARDTAQTLCQLLLERVLNRIGVEANLAELVREHLHIVWMSVTDTDHGVTAIEVKVFLTLIVPNATAISLDGCHIKE